MQSSSHLTRAVFRAIIANRPYAVTGCRRTILRAHDVRSTRPALSYVQKRGLFSALLGATNRGFEGAKPTTKNLELALGKLVDLVRARRTRSRPPAIDDVLDAFRFIFTARLEVQRRLTRNEIYLTTEAFKHFQEQGLIQEDEDLKFLNKKDINMILRALALPSEKEKFRTDTKTLAMLAFNTLPSTLTNDKSRGNVLADSGDHLPVYITVLAKTGSALDALELVQNSTESGVKNNVQVWVSILKGLANEGHVKEFAAAVEGVHETLESLNAAEYEELILFFAHGNRFEEAKRIYEAQTRHNVKPTTLELRRLLELCVQNDDLDWGENHAQALRQRINEDGVMGTIFLWFAAKYRNIDRIDAEIREVLQNASVDDINMDSFNRLFEYGLQESSPNLTRLAMELADSVDLRPDGKTYVIQLAHELRKGDIAAAGGVFDQLVREDIPSDDSDLPVLNKLAAALAFSKNLDYPMLMRVVDTLLERNADLDAEALAGLCRVFLQRDELEDATGLLRHRADFYPAHDRAHISEVFQQFILDPTVAVQRAFNAYDLFRHAFPETSIDKRLPIMQSFFDRKRPDLACLVFGHMRQREDIEARPTPAAYAQCFAGIAQCRDIDGLQMVFNMLKLDLEVEPTTRIRNGLMLAYISCQMPFTAMIDHFWKIMDSREGPTYSTFEIALRACETWVPYGGYEARKIMAIMQAWDLEITKELYDCYVGALAGQSEFENTVELIEEMQKDIGEMPDAVTIGTFYNAIPWQYRKDEVEKWAKKAYPDLWEDLMTYGDEIDEEWEIRYFKFDRTIDIDDEPLFSAGKYDPQISRQAVQALEPLNK